MVTQSFHKIRKNNFIQFLKRVLQGCYGAKNKLKKVRIIWISLLCLSLIGFPLVSHALSVQEVPNPRQAYGGWVTDMANILSESAENQLNQMISELEATTAVEMAVVTVPTTAPAPTPKVFTTELFNQWGIGKKGADNGVLFLTSVGDRRVEIETGYGIEGVLPDAKVGNIISTEITPLFRQGNMEGGILAGTQGLIAAISTTPPLPTITEETEINPINWTPLLLAGGGGLAAIAGGAAYRRKSRRIFIEPTGRSRSEKLFQKKKGLYCSQCKHSLKALEETELDSHLTPQEQVAKQLGSVQFRGIFCSTCSPNRPLSGIHILSQETQLANVTTCPTCQELTITRQVTQIVEKPTWNQTGKHWITEDCHCCDRHEKILEDIPCLEPPANAVFLEPVGRSRVNDSNLTQCDRPAHCQVCRYPLEKVQGAAKEALLCHSETVAQTLGSVKFIAWKCSNCYPESANTFVHIRGYIQSSSILECSTCQELTVTRTERVIQHPTTYGSGIEEIRDHCHCCGQENVQEILLPPLPPPPPPSSYSYSSSDSSSSDSGNFGGGDSGGGGAGGDW